MMLRSLMLVLTAPASLIGTAAVAQHPIVLTKLEQLNAQAPQPPASDIIARVFETAKAVSAAKGMCVPTKVALGEVAAVTGASGVFQAALGGQIRNGWTAYATHDGCSGKEPFRYLLIQQADGTLHAVQVNEGRSFANPSIMRDTSAGAAIAALQKAKSLDTTCTGEKMDMGPTRVVGQSADLGADVFGVRYVGSWNEIWRFTTCGRSFDVPVEFRADGDGGAYTHVRSSEVAVAD